jgi:hypothetical protein
VNPHNTTRLHRAPSACQLTIRFSGTTARGCRGSAHLVTFCHLWHYSTNLGAPPVGRRRDAQDRSTRSTEKSCTSTEFMTASGPISWAKCALASHNTSLSRRSSFVPRAQWAVLLHHLRRRPVPRSPRSASSWRTQFGKAFGCMSASAGQPRPKSPCAG